MGVTVLNMMSACGLGEFMLSVPALFCMIVFTRSQSSIFRL